MKSILLAMLKMGVLDKVDPEKLVDSRIAAMILYLKRHPGNYEGAVRLAGLGVGAQHAALQAMGLTPGDAAKGTEPGAAPLVGVPLADLPKAPAGWSYGNHLPPHLQARAQASFVHRYTGTHRPNWVTWEPVQFLDDNEWLARTMFELTKNGLGPECRSFPSWPKENSR